jgi:membrane protein implicated in regulation of membrane protease activity
MYGQMMGKRKMDGMGRMGAEVEVVEFTPPKELRLEGESGTAMVDWRMTPNGTVEIVAFDGVTLGGGEVEMEEVAGAEMEMDDMEEEA